MYKIIALHLVADPKELEELSAKRAAKLMSHLKAQRLLGSNNPLSSFKPGTSNADPRYIDSEALQKMLKVTVNKKIEVSASTTPQPSQVVVLEPTGQSSISGKFPEIYKACSYSTQFTLLGNHIDDYLAWSVKTEGPHTQKTIEENISRINETIEKILKSKSLKHVSDSVKCEFKASIQCVSSSDPYSV